MPRLIQAGMGVRISSYSLANATSRLGALGVVSSVGLRHIVTEEIRRGDARAIEIARTFPLERYRDELLAFAPGQAWRRRPVPMDHPDPEKGALPKRLSAICAYVEVMRAKQGHGGKVGINIMWKCALTVLPSIYGAMLAGADALLCGAGVPMELPDIVRRIRSGVNLQYFPLNGTGTPVSLDIEDDRPQLLLSGSLPPHLLPILSNFAFPKRILDVWEREYGGARPFAFILEDHRAGGHNAPPRNKIDFGEQDDIDAYFDKVRDLGVPVYVAGAGDTRQDFLSWTARGAYGLQVGSRFALCSESGLRSDLRDAVITRNAEGPAKIETSPRLSSTGYPFKFVPLEGTLSQRQVYENRKRICNLGYLLQSHTVETPDGAIENYICPAMPEAQYSKLGGKAEDARDRICLCNALFSTAGLNESEPPLVTLGLRGSKVTTLQTAREVIEEIMTPEYVAHAVCTLQELAMPAHGAACLSRA